MKTLRIYHYMEGEMRVYITLGEFISSRRKRMRLTQEKLAELVNVSKSAIAKWETDGGIPDRANLMGLADVFKVSIDDLYVIIDENYIPVDKEVNITSEIIAVLESHGYTVIKPEEK